MAFKLQCFSVGFPDSVTVGKWCTFSWACTLHVGFWSSKQARCSKILLIGSDREQQFLVTQNDHESKQL